MAKQIASPKSTGGGGFAFEDKVCAWFLAHMLTGDPPLEPAMGVLDRIDFQARVDGWFLDDLILTLSGAAGTHRCAVSVKSNSQFGNATAPSEFVKTAWEQFLHEGSPRFDEAKDYLAIATAPLSGELREAVSFVIRTAREGDPNLLPNRYPEAGWPNEDKRSLFESFACPGELAERHGITASDTGRLLARLLVLEFDFESVVSEREKSALERCRRVLRSQSVEEGAVLWAELLRLSSGRRPVSGCLTRQALIDELRARFRLAELPNHGADWRRLERLSDNARAQIRDTIGGQVSIPREEALTAIFEALSERTGAVLVGRSGVGKSVVAKLYAERNIAEAGRCVWFDAPSFDRTDYAAFEVDLSLSHELAEVLRSVPDARPLLVLDGLDRLHQDRGFGIVASLIRALDATRERNPWRILITCQTPEWPRLRRSLSRVGVPLESWPLVECEPVSFDALGPVWKRIPAAGRLRLQANLRSLLVNLKILDLIATELLCGGSVMTSGWVGETSVARWFWVANIATGSEASARAHFAMLLAERQADELRPALPLHAFAVAELAPLDGLVRDRICQRSDDDRIGFEHDLFGDWARMQILLSRRDEIGSFLAERLDSPLWHRALRLYGVHLLEMDGDLDIWRATLANLSGHDGSGDGDLLLDSLFFAAEPLPLLDKVCADLVADGGKLLRRLLGRFLIFATVPEAYMRVFALEDEELAAFLRRPDWVYWPPVLRFLHKHRAQCIPVAPLRIAEVVQHWLEYAPPGTMLREEAAELGLMLGERALEEHRNHGSHGHEHPKRYYRAALAGALERPDEVATFALRAANRSPRVVSHDESADVERSPRTIIGLVPRVSAEELESSPWPDGPTESVDESFRSIVLDQTALMPLMRARPAVAREVILASLIEARHRFGRSAQGHARVELDIESGLRWHPPLYIQGPFLAFLKEDFEEGLETIARIVDFATERWGAYTEPGARKHQARIEREGADADPLGRRPPAGVVLPLPGEERQLVGDAHVYGWSAGLGGAPDSVVSALMALEQHFYAEIEAGEPIEDKVRRVLERARSAAFLKVLCEVGKREPALFGGALRSLLAIPEVYQWDIQAAEQNRSFLMIGAELHGRLFFHLARAFHAMAHRAKPFPAIARDLLLSGREDVREFLSSVRQQWEGRIAANPTDPARGILKLLIAGLTVENYRHVVHPEHGRGSVNGRALELYAELAEKRKQIEEQRLPNSLPIRCRQIIDEGTVFSDEEIERFWEQVQRMALRRKEPPAGERTDAAMDSTHSTLRREGDGLANALTGAAAVLLRLHGDWLARDPARRQWCRDQLRWVVMSPPPQGMMDATWTWDCFAAEALPVLWAANPDDRELRELIARLVFAHHYGVVRILFARCAEQRSVLAGSFGQLRRLLLEYAHVRNRVAFVESVGRAMDTLTDDMVRRCWEEVATWTDERVAAFANGALPLPVDDWRAMDQPERFAMIDPLRLQWNGDYFLDFRLVCAAHEWLPELDEAANAAERRAWISFWRGALSFALNRVKGGDDRDSQPCDEESWVLERIAGFLPQVRSDEGPAEFWQPIVDLPSEAHYWSEVFLGAFHSAALKRDPVPPSFASLRASIIEHVLSGGATPADAHSRWPYYERAWTALIGIDDSTRECWEPRHCRLAEESRLLLERWMSHVGRHGGHLAYFASWLQRDAADPVRLPGLVWIAGALSASQADRIYYHEIAADPVAKLLNTTWRKDQPRLQQHAEAFPAFQRLLRWLVAQQNPMALHLVGRLGGLS